MTEPDWATHLATTVAAEMKRLRSRPGHKLSIRKLAERTTELGYPISADVLTNFEVGRRGARLDVAELLVLAAALDTPPGLLLFPGYPDSGAAYLPGRAARSRAAVDWLSGDRALRADTNGEVTLSAFPTELVRATRKRQELRQRTGARYLEAAREFTDDVQDFEDIRQQVEADQQRIKKLEEQIRQLGGVVDDGQG